MSIQKKEYEMSVWKEHLDNKGNKVEEKGAIIGAHNMDYLGRATKVKLTRKLNGTNILTFQMPSKFFDSKLGIFTHNELSDYLQNETKIKLYYKDKWFEFYVKDIKEEKRFKAIMYNYECKDCFIDELSRTGYEVAFQDELNNSVEEIGIFSEEILEDSIWDYKPEFNIGDFTEYKEQKFYKIPVEQFGGKLYGYPINLQVAAAALFDKSGNPKEFLSNKLKEDNINWDILSSDEKEKYLNRILSIKNVFTGEKRALEYGDDLARVDEIFWNPYYKDNGEDLLKNKVDIKGNYIFVPITDLSTISGSVYKNSYLAIEEPALYGDYLTNNKYGYALQPSFKNPKDFIQFIYFNELDEVKIDEDGYISNNNCHYIIPIEEWNNILKEQLEKKSSIIYWTATYSNDSEYNFDYGIDGDIAYTKNITPYTSTIDDFTWWPVYFDGYLDRINEVDITGARKISITNRTEYNKNADIYTTVYNNKAEEFLSDNGYSLYSEEELDERIKDGQDFRITSKDHTRLIVPTLARNLVENGSKITDTNGWEARTQNRNHENLIGTGSSVDLLEVNIQSTVQKIVDNEATDVIIDEYNIDGTINDETVSDYYLEIKSPAFNNTEDFSLQGTTQIDYVLNFGMISQEKQIEKDKVYALRMKTGDIKTTGVQLIYRSDSSTDIFENNYSGIAKSYENTFWLYKDYLDCFLNKNIDKIAEYNLENEFKYFSQMIDIWPTVYDEAKNDKLRLVDSLLKAILFGGENVKIWSANNIETDNKQSIVVETISYIEGIIPKHDKKVDNRYQQFASIAIQSIIKDDGSIIYSNSDTRFLKYCLKNNLSSTAQQNVSLFSDATQLTNGMIRDWIDTYISYNKVFEQKLNQDLDKIVIGQGAIDLNGNYTIQGSEDENGEIKDGDTNYISFKDIFEVEGIAYVPAGEINETTKNKLGINKYIKHYKNGNNWCWAADREDGILDEPFLLFKANQTIINPYIGIKLESGPLDIIFDSIEKTTYVESVSDGYSINISDGDYYYDNVKVKIIPINSLTCSQDFLDLISYDKTTGSFDAAAAKSLDWQDSYLKSAISGWTGTTSANNPVICSTFLKNGNSNASIPYLFIADNIVQGIIYLTQNS